MKNKNGLKAINHYHLYLTSKCNQDCLFCLTKGQKDPQLSSRKIKTLLYKLRKKGIQNISIDGGEPTIVPNFPGLISELKSLQFRNIHIKTNGIKFSDYLFTQKILTPQRRKLITIFLSLHSHRQDIHDYLARKKGSYQNVLKAIQNIIKAKGKLVINIVICKKNYKHLDKFIQFLFKQGISQVIFLFIIPLGNALKYRDLIPSLEEVIPYCKKAIDEGNKLGVHVSLTFFPFCLLGKYKKYAVEYHIQTDLKYFDEYYNLKYDFPLCHECRYFAKCPGVWKNYVKLYNFNPKIIKK